MVDFCLSNKLFEGRVRMIKQHELKLLSPVDGLVVGFVCLFLIAVIPLLCHAARSDAFRMICAKNLSGIGKAMFIYANDYEEKYPLAGGRQSIWARNVKDWKAKNRFAAYGIKPDGSGGQASITSCFYTLVKYTELKPKTFICPNDIGTKEFNPADDSAGDRRIITLWDFGSSPTKHISYAYHMPFSDFALTTSSDPAMAVAADRNPWIDSPFAKSKNFKSFDPNGIEESIKAGNSRSHGSDGQNVLFLDGHVGYERDSFCGIDNDNVYTSWNGDDKTRGTPPKLGSRPADKLDSLLVNDPFVAPDSEEKN